MTEQTRRALLDMLEPWAWIEEQNPEWPAMWLEVPDPSYQCPVTGEVWQYMGSVRQDDWFYHEFRHRNLHGEGKRVVLVRASDEVMRVLLSIGAELRAEEAA